MRVVVVVKKDSEFFREALEWQTDYQFETGKEVELIDPETIEGEIFASAREIMQYPTVLVLGGNGEILKKWSGSPLPQFDQINYIMRSV